MKMLIIVLWMCCQFASAQTKPAPVDRAPAKIAVDVVPDVVPIDKEPSHHLVFENEYVRVFSVEVAPHSETKYHQHDRDYVWVALGDSDVESVRVGEKPVHIQPKDGETQFSKAKFAHKAVNLSDKPFRNVTVELKQPAGKVNPKNQVWADAEDCFPRDCEGFTQTVMTVFDSEMWVVTRRSATGAKEIELPRNALVIPLIETAMSSSSSKKLAIAEVVWLTSLTGAHPVNSNSGSWIVIERKFHSDTTMK